MAASTRSAAVQQTGPWRDWIQERDRNQQWLNERFYDINYPALFLGDEMNTFHFDWDQAIEGGSIDTTWRVVLMNVIASHFSLNSPSVTLFYEQLHDMFPSWVVERSLCPPAAHTKDLMAADGIRPFAVESKMPLAAFDVLCLSMDMTGSAVAIPWTVMASGIPLHSLDRKDEDPYVIMGGSALVNPGPYGPFCDILFFGEGEEVLPELLALLETGRRSGTPREEILLEAAQRWDCLYVPRFYENRYDADGRFTGTFPLRDDVPKRLRFYRVQNMDEVFIQTRPFLNFCTYTPNVSTFEISRGCEGKCAFCLPGYTTLPFRPRDARIVTEHLDRIRYETGNFQVIPVAFSTVSHPQVNQIIRDLSSVLGDKIRLVSQRMDDFEANPEYCCFMSMQKLGRVAFGVEGASQRLRDLVSKNLSEEQILELMPLVCHNGYRIIKFMMICNLPGETEADLDELYELAVKIRRIFERETVPGGVVPRLLITWTPLKISPHTPLQWAKVNYTMMPAYATFTEKIKRLGFTTYTPEIMNSDIMDQLFLRADERLADLLAYLASEGHLTHDAPIENDVFDKTVHFLEEHKLPPLEWWFRELRWEDPLPWDIVEGPASKAYLYKRYLDTLEEQPSNAPICSRECSGCGACDAQQRKVIKGLPSRRKEDVKINLHHPVRTVAFEPVQHVLLGFEHDLLHAVVRPNYWDCEIRRALLHAHIPFDPETVQCVGSEGYACYMATGPNITNISLGKRYDLDELARLIEEHAINFHVSSITELEQPVRARQITYRMPLPEHIDQMALPELFARKLSESEWATEPEKEDMDYALRSDIRPCVGNLEVQGDDLLITINEPYSYPREIYRYLFDIPADQTLRLMPERVGFTLENKGILDLAATREMRDTFVRHLAQRPEYPNRELDDIIAYASSMTCFKDLQSLIKRMYGPEVPSRYLLMLVGFVLHEQDSRYPDDLAHLVSGQTTTQLENLWGEDPAFLDLLKYLLLHDECPGL